MKHIYFILLLIALPFLIWGMDFQELISKTPQEVIDQDQDLQRLREIMRRYEALNFSSSTWDQKSYDTAYNYNKEFNYYKGRMLAKRDFIYVVRQHLADEISSYIQEESNKWDTHSSVDLSSNAFVKKRLQNQYDLIDDIYDRYFDTLTEISKQGADKMFRQIILYNQNVLYKSDSEIEKLLFHFNDIQNQGIRDAGGMGDTEYRIRSFTLNFLHPLFSASTKDEEPESAEEAAVLLLSYLSHSGDNLVNNTTLISVNDMPSSFWGNWYATNSSNTWIFGITMKQLRTGNKYWNYKKINHLSNNFYQLEIVNDVETRIYYFRILSENSLEYSTDSYQYEKLIKR